MLLAAYITAHTFLALYVYEIEVIILEVMSVFWGMMSFRLVNGFGGAPFLRVVHVE
jgi:hypothetical protein